MDNNQNGFQPYDPAGQANNQTQYGQQQTDQTQYGQQQTDQTQYGQQQMDQTQYGQQQMNQTQYGQQQMNQTQYGQQQMNQQYGQQMNQQYGQQMNQQYAQQMNQQYGQQMNPQYNQQYGQMQQQYANAQAKQAMSKFVGNAKNVGNEFKANIKKMGLSTYCLLGIIGAMLLIVAPFMNFASVHVNDKISEDGIHLKVKAADGLNMFELAKLSNTLDRGIDEYNDYAKESKYLSKIDKDDLVDNLEDEMDNFSEEADDEIGLDVDKTSKEVMGITHLVAKGQFILNVAPWLIIISGIGLLVFTVTNKKNLKLVFSAIPLVGLIWLMICSSNFFAMMGIGVWAIVIGLVLGVVSAIKDTPVYY